MGQLGICCKAFAVPSLTEVRGEGNLEEKRYYVSNYTIKQGNFNWESSAYLEKQWDNGFNELN